MHASHVGRPPRLCSKAAVEARIDMVLARSSAGSVERLACRPAAVVPLERPCAGFAKRAVAAAFPGDGSGGRPVTPEEAAEVH